MGFSDTCDETSKQLRPLDIYGYSQAVVRSPGRQKPAASRNRGFEFFNVYGPNENIIKLRCECRYKAFQQIELNGQVELFKSYLPDFGDGEQKRDFVYVKDCCEVIWWLIENPQVTGLFNLGSGTARTWKDLVGAVFASFGREKRINYIEIPAPLRKQYQYFTQAEMTKLRDAGCKLHFHTLEEGVADYVKNYLLTPNPYY